MNRISAKLFFFIFLLVIANLISFWFSASSSPFLSSSSLKCLVRINFVNFKRFNATHSRVTRSADKKLSERSRWNSLLGRQAWKFYWILSNAIQTKADKMMWNLKGELLSWLWERAASCCRSKKILSSWTRREAEELICRDEVMITCFFRQWNKAVDLGSFGSKFCRSTTKTPEKVLIKISWDENFHNVAWRKSIKTQCLFVSSLQAIEERKVFSRTKKKKARNDSVCIKAKAVGGQ